MNAGILLVARSDASATPAVPSPDASRRHRRSPACGSGPPRPRCRWRTRRPHRERPPEDMRAGAHIALAEPGARHRADDAGLTTHRDRAPSRAPWRRAVGGARPGDPSVLWSRRKRAVPVLAGGRDASPRRAMPPSSTAPGEGSRRSCRSGSRSAGRTSGDCRASWTRTRCRLPRASSESPSSRPALRWRGAHRGPAGTSNNDNVRRSWPAHSPGT